ncbi:MAG: pyridoxal 5'-phosphate synthase glutaminase subunit PdxT, partial [Candidatus Gallimonas sp.]
VTVKRNAYGRQLGSFRADLNVEDVGDFPAVFIRAPYIERVGEGVRALAQVEGKCVAVRQNNVLATAFHPELTEDLRIHEYFCNIVRGKA